MDWQDTLIQLYLYLCHYRQHDHFVAAQRLSNNQHPRFTDEEVLTIYLFGILKKHQTLRAIYHYTQDHLADWFPALPCYGGYVQRLNRLHAVLPGLVEAGLEACCRHGVCEHVRLVDSFPVIMAQSKRAGTARVAPALANKGYCAAKQTYFYGVKVHLVAYKRQARLPVPDYIGLSPGASNDLTVLRTLVPRLRDCTVYGDKIYADSELAERLLRTQNVRWCTPLKRRKGQAHLLLTEAAYSTLVSKVRQPIESLFNWIEEQTGIQRASKVRSYEGLLVHIFGRLAAAMFLLAFNP